MKTEIRRVDRDYVKVEKGISDIYKKKFGVKPSQMLISKIIARLVNKQGIRSRKKGKTLYIK